jgi:paired amphipathic helix protein Sin3a
MGEMEAKERWQYYVSSYVRIENTEGINRSRLQKVLLERNLPSGANDSDDGFTPKPLVINEGLVLRICLNSSVIKYEGGTSEYFIYNTTPASKDERDFNEDKQVFLKEIREEKFREKMVMNSPWMKNMSQEEVQKMNEDYLKWVRDGIQRPTAAKDDVVMTD